MTSRASLEAAIATAWRFWDALAEDDDAALAELLTPEAHAAYAATFPESTLAAAIRDHRDLSAEQCRQMGVATEVELLHGDRLRLVFTLTGPLGESYRAAAEVIAWRLVLVPDGDAWHVDPRRWDPPETAIGYIVESPGDEEPPEAAEDTRVH